MTDQTLLQDPGNHTVNLHATFNNYLGSVLEVGWYWPGWHTSTSLAASAWEAYCHFRKIVQNNNLIHSIRSAVSIPALILSTSVPYIG